MYKHEKRDVQDLSDEFYKTKLKGYEAGVSFNLNKQRSGEDIFDRFLRVKMVKQKEKPKNIPFGIRPSDLESTDMDFKTGMQMCIPHK